MSQIASTTTTTAGTAETTTTKVPTMGTPSSLGVSTPSTTSYRSLSGSTTQGTPVSLSLGSSISSSVTQSQSVRTLWSSPSVPKPQLPNSLKGALRNSSSEFRSWVTKMESILKVSKEEQKEQKESQLNVDM